MRTLILIAALGLGSGFGATLRADEIRLQEQAPDRHVVVKGDTLWDISEKFLKDPWKWPEVWGFNKDQIKNPHLIYPGDVVLLTMEGGKPRLSLEKGRFNETVKLSPQIRSEPIIIKDGPIPTVPMSALAPFLNRSGFIDASSLDSAPRIIGASDERVLMMQSDTIFANYGDGVTENWNIVRKGKELFDPESGKPLGFEVIDLGKAETLVHGSPMTVRITKGYMDISTGDRLIPTQSLELESLVPHVPSDDIRGRIISAYGGVQATAKYATVVVNRGTQDGVEPGHVLSIYREGRVIGKQKKAYKDIKDTNVEEQIALLTFGKVPTGEGKSPVSSDFINATEERGGRIEYQGFWDEFMDFIDPFDFFFKPFPDGRRAWRYMDGKCFKSGVNVSGGQFYDPEQAMEECKPTDTVASAKWRYMDIGCLKQGKSISYGQPFDPKDVYDLHCRPEAATKLPDQHTGTLLIYRSLKNFSYGLVMNSNGPIYLLDVVKKP